jgi:serine protease
MTRTGSLVRAAALLAGVLLVTAPRLASQDAPARRLKMSDTSLPAIDLGLSPIARIDAIGGHARVREAGTKEPWVTGRILVKFRDGDRAELVAIDPGENPAEAARRYAGRADVEFAQPDYRARLAFRPNDPLFGNQWNLTSALEMERAWDVNPGASSDVIVAVLDSGMAFDNATYEYFGRGVVAGGRLYPPLGRVVVPFAAAPELAGPSRFVAPRDFIWDDDAPVDLDGHGTHVAGTIGQLTNNGLGVAGVAFNVRLMPVKVIDGQWDFIFNAPNQATTSIVAAGIRYAADNGARVINMSIGFEGEGPLPAVEEALRYAVDKGAFVAVAAGNAFDEGNPPEALAEIAARMEGVISVAAVNRNLDRAYYSSSRSSVEIAAPGGDVRDGPSGGVLQQTYDPVASVADPLFNPVSAFRAPRYDVFAYEAFQGTSMATPHVSGLAALLIQQGITKPAAIEAAIERFATDRGAPGKDNDFGSGLISPRATLRGLGLSR